MIQSTYISGSFRISIMAAMGIPKFDAGPQKSADGVSFILPSLFASTQRGNASVFHGNCF